MFTSSTSVMVQEIVLFRKELHRHPELSGAEHQTAHRIRSFVERHHPTTIIEQVGGTGLAVVYQFSSAGPTIVIRCELDALPIDESNTFPHKSSISGVSHKCGHDGHMAIVLGLIFWLKEQSFTEGTVVLLFQPAEETGEGALRVLKDQRFKNLKPDYIFALHNIPGEPVHSIITMSDGFSAEVQSCSIALQGKTSHASEPEKGINPALAIADLISSLADMNISEPLNNDFSILTPVYINMGDKSYGISPADGQLHYTVRTWSKERMLAVEQAIHGSVSRICQSYKLTYDLKWFEHFPASQNDASSIAMVREAAQINGYVVRERQYPFKFGEDFGWFSRQYKTAMFGLGAGMNCPALHSTDYDFPDEIIETGIKMFTTMITLIMRG